MSIEARTERRHEKPGHVADTRGWFQTDRDRILYSSAFRRLAGITQVVGSGEGHVFHNRLTHSLKAAQIARRIAQRLLQEKKATEELVDMDVVEAAALAHDLGHPPFGHAAEQELDILVCRPKGGAPCEGGFEGNAQTFRILTTLACHRASYLGLNLTRASLRAVIKYPQFRTEGAEPGEGGKWNAYRSETEDFEFALGGDTTKSVEAGIMELGDDIAYSVHDMEDFYRIGWMPLDLLLRDPSDVLAKVPSKEWQKDGLTGDEGLEALNHLIRELEAEVRAALRAPYAGGRSQRIALRSFTSALIGRFIRAAEVTGDPPQAGLAPTQDREVKVLKRVFGCYVYQHPALVAQQYGHRLVVRDLFRAFWSAAQGMKADKHDPKPPDRTLLPAALRDFLKEQEEKIPETRTEERHALRTRVAADSVASLTEQEAIALHRRLTGYDKRTVHDRLVY